MPSWHYHFSIWKKFNCETLNYTKLMTNGTCSTSRFQTSVCAHEATQGQQSYKHDLTHDERTPNVVISALKVSQHWDSGRFCYIHRANATLRFWPGLYQANFNYFSVISHRATKRGINKSVKLGTTQASEKRRKL